MAPPPLQHNRAPYRDRPKLQVVRLEPGQDGASDDPSVEAMAEADARPSEEPVVIRAEGSRVITSAKDASSNKHEYDNALSQVKGKQYDKALEALGAFLAHHPDDTNADNAMYWRGECYFAKGEYGRAAEEFTGLIARFPRGNKVADALLKLGMSQFRAGDRTRSADTYAQLRKQFPSSEAARKIPRE